MVVYHNGRHAHIRMPIAVVLFEIAAIVCLCVVVVVSICGISDML